MQSQSHPPAPAGAESRASVLLAASVVLATAVAPAWSQSEPHLERLIAETAMGDRVFFVEIADEPEEMMLGLMWRRHLEADRGMLFLYDEPQPASFWMRNTYISLDIIFIATDGTVLRVAERTEPLSEETIPSGGPVVAVLEIGAGLAARHGIVPGTRIKHRSLPKL